MTNKHPRFITRQAILNREGGIFAYEISNMSIKKNNNSFEENTAAYNSNDFIDSILFNDINKISNNTFAFIKFNCSDLKNELPTLMDSNKIIISLTKDNLNNNHCNIKNLKRKNYKLSLTNDYNKELDKEALEMDYIKLNATKDISKTLTEISNIKKQFPKAKLVLDNIDSYCSYLKFVDSECDYFQGLFFKKPEIVKVDKITPSKLVTLKLINLANNSDLNFRYIQEEIEKDAALSYRLLKLTNNVSVNNKKHAPFSSLNQAIIYLGEESLRRFVTILSITTLSNDSSPELLSLSLSRAYFIHNMLENISLKESGYLVGLLSLLDTMLNVTFKELAIQLNLAKNITDALINHTDEIGTLLLLCKEIEQGNWGAVNKIIKESTLCLITTQQHYQGALEHADDSLNIKYT